MERRELGERSELAHHVVVDPYRVAEARSSMHHAVADGFDRPPERRRHLVRPGQVVRLEQLVAVAEHPELQAARAGVHDEDVQDGQAQSRTSGMSSPCSRVYARWRRRSSSMCWRRCAAFGPSPGTRSITWATRWKRSMSFIITMSKGVVVVPSSL